MHTEKTAFFFGSGISRLSGASDVRAITQGVLAGKWQSNHLNRYGLTTSASDEKSARLQEFLRRVEVAIGARLRDVGRECTYEDLYGAVRQLEQDVRGEIVNPLIADFASRLKGGIGDILARHAPAKGMDAYTTLLTDSGNFIQWVVFNLLVSVTIPKGMAAISHVAMNADVTNIFSLNHDLLIEAELNRTATRFSDGFEEEEDDVWVFNGKWEKRAVRLFKLHGSINWHRAELPKFEQYVKPKKGDIDHLKVHDKYINLYDDGQPMFLTGAIVKEQAYGTDLVGDMFCRFREILTHHRRLVVCGYGWQDREINLKLQQWLMDQKTNRMLILHNDPTDDIRKNQFWRSRWPRFGIARGRSRVRVRIKDSWLFGCTGEELLDFFNEDPKTAP